MEIYELLQGSMLIFFSSWCLWALAGLYSKKTFFEKCIHPDYACMTASMHLICNHIWDLGKRGFASNLTEPISNATQRGHIRHNKKDPLFVFFYQNAKTKTCAREDKAMPSTNHPQRKRWPIYRKSINLLSSIQRRPRRPKPRSFTSRTRMILINWT